MIKVLTCAPKEYLEQGPIHCGAYTVKAVLSAYGKDVKRHPVEYEPSIFSRYLGISTGIHVWPPILQSYGVHAQKGYAKHLSDIERLKLLKDFLDGEHPVMLRIGNGYAKSGKYHSWAAHVIGHWISLWGYDDGQQVFYVYDPYVARARYDKTIPVGNITRTYSEVLRDWGKGFPFAWRYGYITVG